MLHLCIKQRILRTLKHFNLLFLLIESSHCKQKPKRTMWFLVYTILHPFRHILLCRNITSLFLLLLFLTRITSKQIPLINLSWLYSQSCFYTSLPGKWPSASSWKNTHLSLSQTSFKNCRSVKQEGKKEDCWEVHLSGGNAKLSFYIKVEPFFPCKG